MNENIYLHAVYAFQDKYNEKITNKRLKGILKSDAILSRRLQDKNFTYGFNGLDYISLCDYTKRYARLENQKLYTSYISYIRESLSLIISPERIEIIHPRIIEILKENKNGYRIMHDLGLSSNERYSDLVDEVQVKDKIPLKNMKGITLPIHKMPKRYYKEAKSIDKVIKELITLKELLLKYNYDIPIYDIDSMQELNDDISTRKLIRYHYYYKK